MHKEVLFTKYMFNRSALEVALRICNVKNEKLLEKKLDSMTEDERNGIFLATTLFVMKDGNVNTKILDCIANLQG